MAQQRRAGTAAGAAGAIALAALLAAAVAAADDAGDPPDYQHDVRPVLDGACLPCHGPDEEQNESGLRLDSREGALADLGGYAAVVPGKPQDSELLHRVESDDPDEHMPPPDSGKTLDAAQVDLLRRWIEAGAPDG
jgi:mono/diheme cytochrome c family protein